MKQRIQRFKYLKVKVAGLLMMGMYFYLPQLAYADARGDAQKKLQNDFAGAINGFTGVFQYLSYGVAVLAIIVVGLSGMVLNDEQAIKTTKHRATWVIVIAILIGVAATIITIATNKTS